jgi:hypothetical protein
MRHYARIDDNQKEIVKALRQVGCEVLSLAPIGSGCPDLLVGYRGHLHLMEVKDGSKPPSQRVLTPLEKIFHDRWTAVADWQIHVVYSMEDALVAIGAVR